MTVDESQAVARIAAAEAARQVPGVARLEVGLGSLVVQLAARARARLGDGGEPAATDGVEVDLDGTAARVRVDLAVAAGWQAAAVAGEVQSAVAEALRRAGLTPVEVAVTVLDVEPALTPR